MNDQLKVDVARRIESFLDDSQIETNRFEFKRPWYKFKTVNDNGVESDKNEFFKDVCALVNSYGLEDGFIVIGVSEDKTLHKSRIEDSELTQAGINDLLKSNIDRLITIDIEYLTVRGTQLSVIHIPKSINKPHFVLRYVSKKNIRNHNVIFIRSGTSTVIAGRSDVDNMYLERKDLIIDRKLECSLNINDITFQAYPSHGIQVPIDLTVENLGTRPLRIMRFYLEVAHPPYRGLEYSTQMLFISMDRNQATPWFELEPGQLETKTISFFDLNLSSATAEMAVTFLNSIQKNIKYKSIMAQISTGDKIEAVLKVAEF